MKFLSRTRVLVGWVVALMLSSVVSVAQAAPSPLPKPTGSYSVGRTSFEWTDKSRPDADSPNGGRQLAVFVWYPATPKPGTQPAQWMPGKWADGLWSQLNQLIPTLAQKHKQNAVAGIRAHAYADAPFAAGTKNLPVLVFAPGAGQIPLVQTNLLEDLASHGYVVAAVVPTYYSGFTVLSGRGVVTKDKGLPPLPTHNSPTRTNDKQQAIPLPDGTTVYATPEEIEIDEKKMREHPHTFLSVWTGDMAFVLDQLEKLNADAKSPFKGRLDLKNVGAFGHSYGGASSLQLAKDDARVRAAVDIDGNAWGDVAKNGGVLKPVMLFSQPMPEDQIASDAAALNAVYRTGKPAYRIALAGTKHFSFSDYGMLTFVPQDVKKEALGTIDFTRAQTITRDYLNAFFGQYLLGQKSPLLSGAPAQYPEIQFEVNTAPKKAAAAAVPSTPASSAKGVGGGGLTGAWAGELAESGMPRQTLAFNLIQNGNSVTGDVTGAPPRPDAKNLLSKGTIKGDAISFVINAKDPGGNAAALTFKGKVAGNRIQGTLETPLGKSPLTIVRK